MLYLLQIFLKFKVLICEGRRFATISGIRVGVLSCTIYAKSKYDNVIHKFYHFLLETYICAFTEWKKWHTQQRNSDFISFQTTLHWDHTISLIIVTLSTAAINYINTHYKLHKYTKSITKDSLFHLFISPQRGGGRAWRYCNTRSTRGEGGASPWQLRLGSKISLISKSPYRGRIRY